MTKLVRLTILVLFGVSGYLGWYIQSQVLGIRSSGTIRVNGALQRDAVIYKGSLGCRVIILPKGGYYITSVPVISVGRYSVPPRTLGPNLLYAESGVGRPGVVPLEDWNPRPRSEDGGIHVEFVGVHGERVEADFTQY